VKDGFFDSMDDGIKRSDWLEPTRLVILPFVSSCIKGAIPVHDKLLVIFLIFIILLRLLGSIHIQIHLLDQLVHERTLLFRRQEWVILDHLPTFSLEIRQ